MSPRDRFRSVLFAAMALTLVLTLTPAHPAVAGGTTYGPPSSPLPEFNAGELPETPWMSPQAIELIVNGGFESGSPLPSPAAPGLHVGILPRPPTGDHIHRSPDVLG